MLKSEEIIFEATKEAIARTRRTLLLVSIILGLGIFHLFQWYASWERARIAGRVAVAAAIRQMNARNEWHTGTPDADIAIVKAMESEARTIGQELAQQRVPLPALGISMSVQDFSVGLLLLSVAVLLWLLFYQRRLNHCLRALEKTAGPRIAAQLLQHQFTLIGSHSTPKMRVAASALLFGLPTLAVAFLASDVYDLSAIWRNPTHRLAFSDFRYVLRIGARIGTDLSLVFAVWFLGVKCFREFQKSEDDLLRFADQEDLEEA